MDLGFILEMYTPIVLVICLCVGYVLKHLLDGLDNRFIPLILTTLGAVIACIYGQAVTIDLIASGMVTGLASTGMHQVFKNLIEGENNDG